MTDCAPKRLLPSKISIGHWSLVICWSLVLGHWSFANADSIFVGTLERRNVTIKELKGDQLVFEFNGQTSQLQAGKIRLVVPSESSLTAAEEAFAASKWDDAVDNYQKAQRSSKQWVRDWAGMRLVEAAGKSGRFDAAANAYISMLLKDPSGATTKPAMPNSRSTFIDSAITSVNTALKGPALTIEQKRALLGFLIELHQAKKDQPGEEAAYLQLSQLPGADANDPNAKRLLARRRLLAAEKAMETKNFAQVIAEIESNKASFVDPAQQADALYILAEAQYGLAGSDATRLKDAANAYVRVVALAKNEPGRPHVVESLLKTGLILERLGEPQTASQLYGQIVSQYPDDPATPQARQAMERLK
jgi:hypothetical protein